jgi:energy-coupling factor transporter ATP-binding protein EcfA2
LRTVFVDLPVTREHRISHSHIRQPLLSRLMTGKLMDFSRAFAKEKSGKEITERMEEQVLDDFCATLLIGGPGQGKSTIGQLASQQYRAFLLEESTDLLNARQAELVRSFTRQPTGRSKKELAQPRRHLFPLTLELPKVAVWLREGRSEQKPSMEVPHLIRYLTELPSAKAVNLKAEILWEFVKKLPVFIVLDGFDEVGATKDREAVVLAAREFFQALAHQENSGQVLATTRPQGYADEFSSMGIRLTKWVLMPLEQEEALSYARKLVEAKVDGVDLQQQTLSRLNDATREPATQRLLTTPLQVTILTALVQQLGGVPRERWNLFSRYFSYTYDREIERKSYASTILLSHRNHIERIHARVALLLQVEAESVGGAEARMSRQRLEEVIVEVLREDEVAEETQGRLVAEIAKAAEQRLVFLVEPEPGKFGFEIRSLQEFMAAWALTDGRDDDVVQRMGQVARASMFRNVIVFVASRLYSNTSPLRENICRVCDELNNPSFDELGAVSKAGSVLAMDIIEEGAITSQPKQSRAVMERAVQVLDVPLAFDHVKLSNIVDGDNEGVLVGVIRHLLGQSNSSATTVAACWNCLVAADAADKSWAFDILQENIEKFISEPYLLNRSSKFAAEISFRVQYLVEKNSSLISILDVVDFSCARRVSGQPVTWLAAMSATLGKDSPQRYRRLMLRGLEGRMQSEAPLPPNSPPPPGWEGVAACVRFENSPSAENLALALRELAKELNKHLWSQLAWRSSWPLAACLNAADTPEVLIDWSQRFESGALGDIQDWLLAEKQWEPSLDIDVVLNVSDSDLPWNTKKITLTPPLMALPPWAVKYERRKQAIKLSTLRQADKVFREARSLKLKQHLATICIQLLPDVTASTLTKYVDVADWLRTSPSSAGYLAVKPSALPIDEWFSLLSQVDLKKLDFWGFGLTLVFQSFEDAPWHPFAVETLATTLGAHSRRYRREMLAEKGALREQLDLWKKTAPLDILANGRTAVVGYLAGVVEPSKDKDAIQIIADEAKVDEHRWAELFGALRYSPLEFSRMERLLIEVARLGKASMEVAENLRDRLQSRRSGLDLPGVWTRLNLALPRPHFGAEETEVNDVPTLLPVHLKSVELTDVGRLRKLTISPNPSDKTLGQWVVILGPNGSGKSTLLKSIALSLRNLKNPAIWPRGTFGSVWRHITKGNASASEAFIEISMNDDRSFKSTIQSDDAGRSLQTPTRTGTSPFPVFAYGCRRGSALGGGAREVNLNSDDGPEIATLFDEDSYLVHAETWLVSLEGDALKTSRSARVFGAVIDALKDLLDLEAIEVVDKKVWAKEKNGPRLHISSLSDGYLTTAGWFLDLVARWVEHPDRRTVDPDEQFLKGMTGLVLIDEIDLHLHPQWQMDVIARTRRVLPRMSFWVTTHNPLCLVGAKAEEIWILDNDGEDITVAPGKEAPLLLTGGQIYKKYFGIGDIYPDELGRSLQRYSFLHSFEGKTNDEVEEMTRLAVKLTEHGLLPDWSARPVGIVGRS